MARVALITGATGFVGGHLVERLTSEGWTVRALVRGTSDTRRLEAFGVELRRGDLDDVEAMRAAANGADTVYHLAATTFGRNEAELIRSNARGTRNLAEAIASAADRPRRLVYLSSYAACGPSDGDRPRRLDETARPLTAYGRTKLEGEKEVVSARRAGVEVTIIRAPAVYGPGDRAMLAYYRLVKWHVAPSPGGGDTRLHLIFAPDLATALTRAADVRPGTYPVAEPVVHRWDDIVQAISVAMARKPLRLPLPRPLVRGAAAVTQAIGGLGGRAVPFNREKAEEMLAAGWVCDLAGSEDLLPREEVTPLSVGIARTVEWYKRQGWL